MEKTFKEILCDTEEGQIWENKDKIIEKVNDNIVVSYKEDAKLNFMVFNDNEIFTLQRQEYDFIEAWKAYKEGKEIESLNSGYKLKLIDGKDMYFNKTYYEWDTTNDMDYDEINGKWYIND